VKDSLKRLFGGPRPPSAPVPDKNADYDEQAVAVMKSVLEAGSNCVDVGCHVGLILDKILAFAPRGRHYAFEPLPDMHAILLQKYGKLASVNLYELALSEAAGTSTFQNVVSNPQYSGILRRRFDRAEESVVEITVRLARLDDVLPSNANVRLMKVDVEGAELQVFRGAVETLRKYRPYVIFEHGMGAADCYGTTPGQVHELLTQCGLKVSLLGDWLATRGRTTLDQQAFKGEFESRGNWYFLAHP